MSQYFTRVSSGTGGIDSTAHRELDQIVHEVAEDSFTEVGYLDGYKISSIIVWTDSGKTKKIREEQYSYNSCGLISQQITIQYDSSGVVAETLTETLTYNGILISNITAVLT